MRLHIYHLLIPALVAGTSSHAQFEPLAPRDTLAHEGECFTVEGRAHIFPDPLRLGTDVELGRPHEFLGYILPGHEHVYQNLRAYDGRMVDITGVIQFYLSVPEIKMTDAHQLMMAPPAGQPRKPIQC
jgi:hypothetical protein